MSLWRARDRSTFRAPRTSDDAAVSAAGRGHRPSPPPPSRLARAPPRPPSPPRSRARCRRGTARPRPRSRASSASPPPRLAQIPSAAFSASISSRSANDDEASRSPPSPSSPPPSWSPNASDRAWFVKSLRASFWRCLAASLRRWGGGLGRQIEERDGGRSWTRGGREREKARAIRDRRRGERSARAPSFLLLRRDPRLEAVPPRRAATAHDARASRALLRVRARASIPSRRRRQ